MNPSPKPISAIMSRDVAQVGPRQAVTDALALMRNHSVSSVLVVQDRMLLGIITEHDVVRMLQQARDLRQLSCADLMQSPVIAVGADVPWLDAYHLMAGRSIRHLAITDQQHHVLGVVSEGDMMRSFGLEYYTNLKDVGGVMSTRLCKLAPASLVADALQQMVQQHQSCVVVVDEAGHPEGILTERDVVRLSSGEVPIQELTLFEAMHSPVITVRPQKPLYEAVKMMESAHIRRLVVVQESGAVCGLLTIHEVARGMEGEYVTFLKDMVDLQARTLAQAAQAIDDKLLLANILQSMSGMAVLAADLDGRISYATPSVQPVLGLRKDDLVGADLRATLKGLGCTCALSFTPEAVARGPQRCVAETGGRKTEFRVSTLLDEQRQAKGYLVLAQQLTSG